MKVLFIAGSGNGGSNMSLRNLVIGLLNLNNEIIVVVPNLTTSNKFSDICKTIVVPYRAHVWPSLKTGYDKLVFILRILFYSIENIIAYCKMLIIIQEVKPDIIHTNTSIIKIGFDLSRVLGIKHVWHIREYINEDFDMNPFPSFKKYKEILKISNTIAVSQDIKDYFELSDSCKVIYNGVFDSKYIPEISINKNDFFLYVGAITKKKGVDWLIDAFIEYCSKTDFNTKLLLAGSGGKDYIKQLQYKLSVRNLSNRVYFLGQRNDVSLLMSKAIALIVPSYREAFGRITAEAMYYGCMVIGRNTGGTKEQLDLGMYETKKEIGLRFNTVNELIDSLIIANYTSKDVYEMLKNAQNTVVEKYNIEKCSKDVYHTYLNLIK